MYSQAEPPPGLLGKVQRKILCIVENKYCIFLDKYCRVSKPGVPRGPASTSGLGPGEQHVVHGPAQKSKNTTGRKDSPVADWKVCPKERTPAHQLLWPTSDRSAHLEHQPPPGGLSDRKAWPKTLLPTRPRVSDRGPIGSLLTALLRLAQPGPTGPSNRGRLLRRHQG